MPNFLFVIRSNVENARQPSPEELQQIMESWSKWINEGFAKGWMVDPGDALKPEGKVINADMMVTDGPFAESKEVVGGFSIIKAKSIAEALEISKTCPALVEDGTVEIREMAGLAPPKE